MLNSCLVFKNGESNQEPWFNGVHSILGYSSQSIWFSKSYRCGVLNLKTCHRYSYYTERDFASNWIKGKQGIWESFKNAVSKNILKEGGYGVEPMLRLLSGNDTYCETHNALFDAMDELEIMRLLNHPLASYPPL